MAETLAFNADIQHDAHLLIAQLHRRALMRMVAASGRHHQGLAMAAKALGVSPNWARRLRSWDASLGLAEKISPCSINEYIQKLDVEINRCRVKGYSRPQCTEDCVSTSIGDSSSDSDNAFMDDMGNNKVDGDINHMAPIDE